MNFRGRFSSPLNRLNSGTRARKSRRLGARALSARLAAGALVAAPLVGAAPALDRKSTRLNSSHVAISYAVFCLKNKNTLSDGHPAGLLSHPAADEPRCLL